MQTGRDVIKALFDKRPADFVPFKDSPWGDTMRKWATEGLPTNDEGKPVNADEHFGFDMVGAGGWFRWMAKPETVTLEENDRWKIVRNGNGGVLKWWKEKSGTPEHIDFHMASRKIWEDEYKPHLVGDPHERVGDTEGIPERIKHRRDNGKWCFFGNQFIWENLRASLGDVNMFMALLDDPGWIHDFNRTYTDLYKSCFKILLEEGGVPDGIWIYEDLGYRDRLFCSPEMLRDLIFPYYKELNDFFHSYDLPVVLHSCGYQEPMIPLAIEAGFDALNPMEAKAGNDIFKYAERHGDDLCFIGGLDARVLESGDRDLIKTEVRSIVNGMRERGARYIYGSDHSLSTNIHYDDFVYSLEVYRDCRMN